MNQSILEKAFDIYGKEFNPDGEESLLTNRMHTELSGRLDGENRVLFNKFVKERGEESDKLSYENFKRGFRANIMLMLEILND
ncbi:MAG: hypothetical protein FWG33_04685 [Oscillospiraceae bacterium]|nr:hypothetical protein [Oscillospiraceae bacterium]